MKRGEKSTEVCVDVTDIRVERNGYLPGSEGNTNLLSSCIMGNEDDNPSVSDSEILNCRSVFFHF